MILASQAFAELRVSYGIPEGFSAAEISDSISYVATFNGGTLPGLIQYSSQQKRLAFDQKKYRINGVLQEDLDIIQNILKKLDYARCDQGCDQEISGYRVSIDKQRRTLAIRDLSDSYEHPKTGWGLVNNQSIDLRGASDSYRALNLSGNTWMGMPFRSFGYMNWYANHSRMQDYRNHTQGVSSYFFQKNFDNFYIRTGRQDSADFMAGSVSTLLGPSFDRFVTIGSQDNRLSSVLCGKNLHQAACCTAAA